MGTKISKARFDDKPGWEGRAAKKNNHKVTLGIIRLLVANEVDMLSSCEHLIHVFTAVLHNLGLPKEDAMKTASYAVDRGYQVIEKEGVWIDKYIKDTKKHKIRSDNNLRALAKSFLD